MGQRKQLLTSEMKAGITQAKVAILGGGLAGLAAADRLMHKAEKPLIIEKEQTVGGLCRSFKRDAFIFDLGGHRFLPHNKAIADFVSTLFDDEEFCLRDRSSKIYLKKRFVHYPPELLDILKNLGVFTCLRSVADFIYFRIKHLILKKPEVSLRDWLLNRFGYTLYNIYFGPYSFKLWGRDPGNISSDWAPQRISVPNFAIAIKSLLISDKKPIKTFARRFLYPKGGIGEIPKRMAEMVTNQGARVFTNLKVCKIVIGPDGFIIEAITPQQERKKFFASKVISTIPLTEMLNILSPSPPREILDSVNSLRFRSVRFLNLMLDIPRITQNTWMYIPERQYVFFRIQESANWHPDNSPSGKTALTLEIACEKDGRLWQMQEEDLLKICINDLKKMGIGLEDKILGFFSTYAEYAYPVYSIRYKEYLRKIFDYIRSIDNLIICGRQGLFRYINMDAVIENSFDATESLYSKGRRNRFLTCDDKKEYLETNLYFQK